METPLTPAEPLFKTSKRFARRLLTIGENRLELLMVEAQEGRERLLRAILLALGFVALGLLTGISLTGAIVVLLWELSRVAALLTLTGLYGATAVGLYRRLTLLLRNWENLPATVEQLRKDRACVKEHLAYARKAGSGTGEVAWDCIRSVWSPGSGLAIAPLQDLLNLGAERRMNVPGVAAGNWRWRCTEDLRKPSICERLRDLTTSAGRMSFVKTEVHTHDLALEEQQTSNTTP